MQIQFIGSGSAFTVGNDNYHSNMLLTAEDGSRLLIDCGTDARHSLNALGLGYQDITDVYISHLHMDHAGGLEWLGYSRRFDPSCNKPNLYIHTDMADALWKHCLSGSMRSLENEAATLDSYFNMHPIQTSFIWHGIEFTLIQTHHVKDDADWVPCYGLLFSVNGHTTFITADTQFTPDRLMPYYEQADSIFHDCETTSQASCVHANFTSLCKLPTHIKNKMHLYHFNPGKLPDEKQAGFIGFVKRGDCFSLTTGEQQCH